MACLLVLLLSVMSTASSLFTLIVAIVGRESPVPFIIMTLLISLLTCIFAYLDVEV